MLKVRKTGYYNRSVRGPSKKWSGNEALTLAIHEIFKGSFGSYGAPRTRVARIMRANGPFAKRKGKFRATTDSKHDDPIAPIYGP